MRFLRRLFGLKVAPRHGDPLPKQKAATQELMILEIAREYAAREGLRWIEPVHAAYLYSPDGPYWLVQTNFTGRGYTVFIAINDETRDVIGTHSLPR